MNTPKFKEGEWIKRKEDGRTAQVLMLLRTCYSLRLADDDGWLLDYDSQDNWEIISNPNEESGSSEVPKDLEEAAKSLFPDPDIEKGTSVFANDEWSEVEKLRKAFILGVQLGAEHLKK